MTLKPSISTTKGAPQPIGVPGGTVDTPYGGLPGYGVFTDTPSDSLGRSRGTYVDYGLGSQFVQGPRYSDGAQFGPATMNTDDMIGLQQALVAAGYMGKGWTAGVWDQASQAAFAELLADANTMGLAWEDLLGKVNAQGGKAGSGGGGGGGAARLLPSPEDVKALLNDSAYKLIGKNLDQSSLDAGVQAFYNAYQPQGGYSPADPTTLAANQVKSTMPDEVAAHGTANVYGVFAKMLGGIQ